MTSLPAVHRQNDAPMPAFGGASPRTERTRIRVRQRRLAEKLSILDHLAQPLGILGPDEVEIRFGAGDVQTIDADSVAVLGELVIVTGKHGVFIEPVGKGEDPGHCMLIGKHRSENDCLLLFRHAYGSVCCQLAMSDLSADTHVGFLRHGDFEEVRAFSFATPRGSLRYEHAGFDAVLRYHATELNELQGIVWRGGQLRIDGITLTP